MIENTIVAITNYFVCLVSKDVLFWTFSTIVQSFVAFIALLGMVAVYKMQMIERSIESVAESMREHLCTYRKAIIEIRDKESVATFSSSEVYGYTVKKIIKDIKGLFKKYPNDIVLKRANVEFSNLKEDKNNIRKAATSLFRSTIFLLISSLVLLPMSPVLECTFGGLLFLCLIIFWSFISFVLGLKLLISLI